MRQDERILQVAVVTGLLALAAGTLYSRAAAPEGMAAAEESLIDGALAPAAVAQAPAEAPPAAALEPMFEGLPPGDAAAPALGGENVPGAAGSDTAAQAPETEAGAPPVTVEVVTEGGAPGESVSLTEQDVGDIITQEKLRRQALEEHGRYSLQEAEKAFRERRYQAAADLYEQAVKNTAIRPETAEDLKRAQRGLRESLYRSAIQLKDQRQFEPARVAARRAGSLGETRSSRLIEEIEDMEKAPPPPPKPEVRWEEEDYVQKNEDVHATLKRAREHYAAREYEKAQAACERVLKKDPQNTEAMRLIQKVVQVKYDRATMELDGTRRDMTADVRKNWNPRNYGLEDEGIAPPSLLPGDVGGRERGETQQLKIIRKMEEIKIPEVDFRQANINDVIKFLQESSVTYDTSPEKTGVNIILNLPKAGPEPAVSETELFEPGNVAPRPSGDIAPITFSARQISLLEALKIVTSVAGLKYRVEGRVVMVLSSDAPIGEIMMRMYDVLPTAIERMSEIQKSVETTERRRPGREENFLEMGEGMDTRTLVDLKTFFSDMGVQWPQGSSIKYVKAIAKIVVANTAENLTTFETVLQSLNVMPSQIEIEARFVEIAQTDLMSMGLEWLLNDNWELLVKKGYDAASLASAPRIIMPANAAAGGFTRGERFLTDGSGGLGTGTVSDRILSIAGILTNPELSVIIHALEQKGNADLLSAPKVTTQSGAEATIKVVTEYIYPTEFTVSGLQSVVGGQTASTTVNTGAVVEPGGFETREVGVILTVLPEVSAEGQMINLMMTPEVVSEPTWKNYGSIYTDAAGNETQLNMEQPFFHRRTVTTSLMIYNGATVVMGGMITEVRTDVDDKIPLLGDIPILGRLFRSRYEKSEKRNLLIFVTARLVDPEGRARKRAGAMPETVPTTPETATP